jgi:glutamate racemase
LLPVIQKYTPSNIKIISQGPIVANSLKEYLDRHREIETICSQNGQLAFYTTDDPRDFENKAKIFFGQPIAASHISV